MKPIVLSLSAALLLSACAAALPSTSAPKAGFDIASGTAREALGKDTVWLQSEAEIAANSERVHAMVHRKTLTADTAVQVALLNNRGLQADYADLGVSSAEAWQATLKPNPTLSIGVLGIGAAGTGIFSAIEGMIATNVLALSNHATTTKRADIAFRQAQLRAAQDTLAVASEARMAWIDAVAAFEAASLVRQAEGTADAASELTSQLGQTGAMNKAEQAREQAFHAELAGERARAKLGAAVAKERLARALGLWGADVDFYVPDALPSLPKSTKSRKNIEAEALARRVDLAIAKLDLEAVAQDRKLTNATRTVTDLELVAGFETERESGEDGIETKTTPQLEVAFTIPVFDSGKARLKKDEGAYLRAAHSLAALAVDVRSEAREAHLTYQGSYKIARHYRDVVLPIRRQIDEEALLSYNGMISNTFELLEDSRDRLESTLTAAQAKADFWRADAAIVSAIYGGESSGGPGSTTAETEE